MVKMAALTFSFDAGNTQQSIKGVQEMIGLAQQTIIMICLVLFAQFFNMITHTGKRCAQVMGNIIRHATYTLHQFLYPVQQRI